MNTYSVVNVFVNFSNGYWLGRFTLYPSSDENNLKMQEYDYNRIYEELYDGEHEPIIVRIGPTHVPVTPDESLPSGNLQVPNQILRKSDIHFPPEEHPVLLAKPDTARALVETEWDKRFTG